MKLISSLGTSAIVAAAALMSAPAGAQSIDRVFVSNPAGICQGALPVYDSLIRKRPLAVQNVGNADAFVTCSFTSQGGYNGSDTQRVSMWFRATGGAAATISCTAVTGYDTGFNEFVTKTVVAPASGQQVNIAWRGVDFEDAPAEIIDDGLFSVSCTLPAGTAINDSYINFAEDVATETPPT